MAIPPFGSPPAPLATTTLAGKIQLTNDISGTAIAPTVVATHLASALPINQGGTGSITQNFVDLTAGQTIAGTKAFSSTISGSINGNAATVTTNANLTGPITSSGNATSIASQTGTGSKFVVDTGPTITNLTNNTLLTANTELDVIGTSGDLHFTAASDGGDYNIFSSNGNQTLAMYGSGGNTLNLHLLDGIASFDGGTNTAAGAVITTPTFVSTTAQQISTTKDAMVYIDVKTAASLTLAIGAASTATTLLQSAVVSGLGLSSIRVPAGWFLKITGTISDLVITAITC